MHHSRTGRSAHFFCAPRPNGSTIREPEVPNADLKTLHHARTGRPANFLVLKLCTPSHTRAPKQSKKPAPPASKCDIHMKNQHSEQIWSALGFLRLLKNGRVTSTNSLKPPITFQDAHHARTGAELSRTRTTLARERPRTPHSAPLPRESVQGMPSVHHSRTGAPLGP